MSRSEPTLADFWCNSHVGGGSQNNESNEDRDEAAASPKRRRTEHGFQPMKAQSQGNEQPIFHADAGTPQTRSLQTRTIYTPAARMAVVKAKRRREDLETSTRAFAQARTVRENACIAFHDAKRSTQAATLKAEDLAARASAAVFSADLAEAAAADARMAAQNGTDAWEEATMMAESVRTAMAASRAAADLARQTNKANIEALDALVGVVNNEDVPANMRAERQLAEAMARAEHDRKAIKENIHTFMAVDPSFGEFLATSVRNDDFVEPPADLVAGLSSDDVESVRLAGRATAEAMRAATQSAVEEGKARMRSEGGRALVTGIDAASLAGREERVVREATKLEALRKRESGRRKECMALLEAANQADEAYDEAMADFDVNEAAYPSASLLEEESLAEKALADEAAATAEAELERATAKELLLQQQATDAATDLAALQAAERRAEKEWDAALSSLLRARVAHETQCLLE